MPGNQYRKATGLIRRNLSAKGLLGLGAASWPRAPGAGRETPWPVGAHWESDLDSDRAFHHPAEDSFIEHTLTEGSPHARHDSRRRAHSCVVLGKSLDPSERQFLHVRNCRVGRLQGR